MVWGKDHHRQSHGAEIDNQMQHCQKMAPEFSKAALGVYPMIPFYAVDCDKQSNKKLCAEQGVQGFPTIKVCSAFGRPDAAPADAPSATL